MTIEQLLHSIISSGKLKINLKTVLSLYASLWFFNEFAYEFSLWVRALPLIAFYFLGYCSAMTTSLKLVEQEPASEV